MEKLSNFPKRNWVRDKVELKQGFISDRVDATFPRNHDDTTRVFRSRANDGDHARSPGSPTPGVPKHAPLLRILGWRRARFWRGGVEVTAIVDATKCFLRESQTIQSA